MLDHTSGENSQDASANVLLVLRILIDCGSVTVPVCWPRSRRRRQRRRRRRRRRTGTCIAYQGIGVCPQHGIITNWTATSLHTSCTRRQHISCIQVGQVLSWLLLQLLLLNGSRHGLYHFCVLPMRQNTSRQHFHVRAVASQLEKVN